mgnify:FL=1
MTLVIPLSEDTCCRLAGTSILRKRQASHEDWMDIHASGTCRKNARLGFAYKQQLLHERVAWEFGYAFNLCPTSRITTGIPLTEGDCKPVTEAGWHIDRLLSRNPFPEDVYTVAYIYISGPDGNREGIGVVLETTSAPFIPNGHTVYAIIAEYDPIKKVWLQAVPV